MENPEKNMPQPAGLVEKWRNFWQERQDRRQVERLVGGFALIGAEHDRLEPGSINNSLSSFIISHS